MWKEGSLKVHDSVFHYWMKQYDEGSEFGIDGGRISLPSLRSPNFLFVLDKGFTLFRFVRI